MFSHIMIGANDLDASKKFYSALFEVLGGPQPFTDPKGRIFFAGQSGVLALTSPINGEPASGANGGTIGFAASSPEQVEAWHKAGLAAGGTACEDPPGLRADSNLYLAYLLDPAGNKLCALHRMPAKGE
ncbi:VOC family protein [Novosphingobium pentaromativorans]|uniref:VOC domain-containing protein n=1 Tax=Novosphingobium pentaromativorans US6-1 TaxID=1088721 RepID=G6EDA5_9SPHN|nr:VOC family protein [Novosphingobium pentaromativorans]AIT79809.1 glyoxalase [Novosphingobium pentaromativorans US6-1]EHJ60704.1 hypothetical protein NSU_2326 [Novosphingobium pentaromativorans US6-1]